MRDQADPHAHGRAVEVAREHPPLGISPDEAVAAVEDALVSIGDSCPECPPDAGRRPSHQRAADVPSPPSI
jgi:hypothetical protein